MSEIYKLIECEKEAVYKSKSSKFIAKSFKVETPTQAMNVLKEIRKQYHDARHYCFAYALGTDAATTRSSDDGEPSGTAGKPIAGAIKSFGVTNVLVVVIRYFGGTLLGTGGLVKAYKEATREVLELSGSQELRVLQTFQIRFPFQRTNTVMQLIHKLGLEIAEQEFTETCSMKFHLPPSKIDQAKAVFTKNLIETYE